MSVPAFVHRITTTLSLLFICAIAMASPAAAHPHDEVRLGGGAEGFLHPLTGPDHLAAMVAVGIIAALAYRRLPLLAVPGAFVGGMVAGGVLGLTGVAVGAVELVITGSVVVFGLIVVAARQLPLGWWLVPAVALVGAAHGNAHGLEAPHAAAPVAYVIGFVAATIVLHAAGAAAGFAMRRFQVGQIIGGALITALGVSLFVAG